MSKRPRTEVPTLLAAAGQQFERWRSQRQGRARLPQELWAKAVVLARQHGVYKTALTLGLKYGSLKKHLAAATGPGQADRAKAGMAAGCGDFVELVPTALAGSWPQCMIEWSGPRHATMRMHVRGISLADLVELAVSLRKGQP
jgi:hypothetical protein